MSLNKQQQPTETRYSQDSACDSTITEDSSSIYSTSSSMFSTSSRISKIPNAVKSSVKYLVRRNKNRSNNNNNETAASTTTNESFTSKLKRTTINFSLFSSSSSPPSSSSTTRQIIPTTTASSTLFNNTHHYISQSKAKRRNSVINLASRFLPTTTTTTTTTAAAAAAATTTTTTIKHEDDHESIIDDSSNYIIHESDSKSEKITKKKEEPWIRQRAKSCQENKAPMLRQLATKGSAHKLSLDEDTVEKKPTSSTIHDLPLFKGLVTTTLTTLNTRLMNECDRTLSMLLLSNPSASAVTTAQEQLTSMIADLYKMTEMVNWEQQEQMKYQVKDGIQQLEKTISKEELNIITVKDIVSTMKQLMNQCICQYYKVVEKAMVIPSKGYRIEGINKYGTLDTIFIQHEQHQPYDYHTTPIDHKDPEAHWYRTYFLQDTQHVHTFFGYNNGDPILISIKVEMLANGKRQYRVIYRTKNNPDQRKLVMDSFLLNPPNSTATACVEDSTFKTIIETMIPDYPQLLKMSGDQMVTSGLQQELLKLDENPLHTNHKFGVLLMKQGQTKEEEWFSNQHDSKPFNEFLDIIGRKTKLKDYTGWAGQLDTKSGDSGEYTYTNVWNENILAYHVSTLIPSKPGDRQQIQRKRHIGNDIVCVVFVEGNQPFNPTAIKSQFLHVFIIVHQEIYKENKAWRVEIVSIEDVPTFGPALPGKTAVFFSEKELESFLLAKLVNAEYAALKSPKFALPMSRARGGIFANLVEKGYKLLQQPPPPPSSSSDEEQDLTKKHTKSYSSASSQSSSFNHPITPSPSKSSVIREISENIVGLGKRRSTQELLNDKPIQSYSSSSSSNSNHAQTRSKKFTEGSKRSLSEQDLMNITSDTPIAKNTLKNRAQHILTSIPGFGNHNGNHGHSSRRRSSTTSQQ